MRVAIVVVFVGCTIIVSLIYDFRFVSFQIHQRGAGRAQFISLVVQPASPPPSLPHVQY